MAASAGRLDDALAARPARPGGSSARAASRSSPRPCSTSRPRSARGRGRPGRAAALIAAGWPRARAWSARYSWPLDVAGRADRRRRGRARRGTGTSRWSSPMAARAGARSLEAASGRRPRPPGPTGAMTEAERRRRTASRPSRAWQDAVAAWQAAATPGRWRTRGSGWPRRCAATSDRAAATGCCARPAAAAAERLGAAAAARRRPGAGPPGPGRAGRRRRGAAAAPAACRSG